MPGMFVLLKGLDSADLNNKLGIVQKSWQNGLYVVEPESGACISVFAHNLVPIPPPYGAWVCRRCKVHAYWSSSPRPGWTGGKGKWKCPSCSSA